MYLLKEYVVTP